MGLTWALEQAVDLGVPNLHPRVALFLDNLATMNIDHHEGAITLVPEVGEMYLPKEARAFTSGYSGSDSLLGSNVLETNMDRDTLEAFKIRMTGETRSDIIDQHRQKIERLAMVRIGLMPALAG